MKKFDSDYPGNMRQVGTSLGERHILPVLEQKFDTCDFYVISKQNRVIGEERMSIEK